MSEKIDDGKVTEDSKVLDESKAEQVSGGYEEPAVQCTGNDAQTEGIFFVPVFLAVNANVVVNAVVAVNASAAANMNVAANGNVTANVFTSTNAIVMDEEDEEKLRRRR